MTDVNVTYRFDRGLSWAPEGSSMLQCRSHALVAADGGVWLVDPFDGAGLEAELAGLGPVVGVIVLLDRHVRDASLLARRHGVPLLVPPGRWRRGQAPPAGATVETAVVEGCPFEFHPMVQRDGSWLEQALWWADERILIIAETVGATDAYLAEPEAPLGVHPILRVGGVPAGLTDLALEPRLLLLGHGAPIDHDAMSALLAATTTARSHLPRLLLRTPKLVAGWLRDSRHGMRLSC